jgi:hypothetical protein
LRIVVSGPTMMETLAILPKSDIKMATLFPSILSTIPR